METGNNKERIGLYIDYDLYSKLSDLRSIYLLSGKGLHDLPEMNDIIRAIVYLVSVEIQPNFDRELTKKGRPGKAKMNVVRDTMKLHIILNHERKSIQEQGQRGMLDKNSENKLKLDENLSKELITGYEELVYPSKDYDFYQGDEYIIENPLYNPQAKEKPISTVAIMDDNDLEAVAKIAKILKEIPLSEHYTDSEEIPELENEYNFTKSEIIRECLIVFFSKIRVLTKMAFILPSYTGFLFDLSPLTSVKLSFKKMASSTVFTEEEKNQIRKVTTEIPTINNFITLTRWGGSTKNYLRELRKYIEPGSSKSHFIPMNSDNYGFSYHTAFLGYSYLAYMISQGSNLNLIEVFNSLIAEKNRKFYLQMLENGLNSFVSRLDLFKTTIESLTPL